MRRPPVPVTEQQRAAIRKAHRLGASIRFLGQCYGGREAVREVLRGEGVGDGATDAGGVVRDREG